jgi:LPS sulfotransferase NodH
MPLHYSIAELDSALYDAPANAPLEIRCKVIVCSSPRTGSYLLCEAMRQAGIGVPHEYLNTPTIEVLSKRWGLRAPTRRDRGLAQWFLSARDQDAALAAYLDALQRRRSREGVFAAKIQYWQYLGYLHNDPGRALLDGAHFIYLYRNELLDQAISLRLAKLTGQWGADGTVTTDARRNGDFFDLGAIDRDIENILREEAGWRRFFARCGISPLALAFENLRADPLATARRLARMLRPSKPPTEGAQAPSVAAEPDVETRRLKSEVRAAYLARRKLPIRGAVWPEGSP